MRFRSPLPIALLPFAWFGIYLATWHFWLPSLLLPVSLFALAVPLCFGYSASLMHQPQGTTARPTGLPVATAASISLAVVAYGFCLYGASAVYGLVPENYKFGGSVAYLSLSTVSVWACITAGGLLAAAALGRLQPAGSRGAKFARASIGMFAAGAAFLVPLLLSDRVLYRA